MPQLLDIDAMYPFLDDGLEYLLEKKVVSGKQYAKLSQANKLKAIGSATIKSQAQAVQLRKALAESFKAGEDERQFADRIKDQVDLLRSDSNRILRTATKQGYVEGMAKTLEKPHIAEAFPYAMFVNTHDGRTRPTHEALGKEANGNNIARVGSAKYQGFIDALNEWQCRCSLIPLTAKQAKARGVDVPDELLPQLPAST